MISKSEDRPQIMRAGVIADSGATSEQEQKKKKKGGDAGNQALEWHDPSLEKWSAVVIRTIRDVRESALTDVIRQTSSRIRHLRRD